MATPERGPVRVVPVDNHEMVLEGLKAMLAAFRSRVLVAAGGRDGDGDGDDRDGHYALTLQ